MKRDYTSKPIHLPRRKDRMVEDEKWIIELLHRSPFGAFAFSHNEQPVINSNIFVYDVNRHTIYFHTAKEGYTRSVVEKGGNTCFSISEMGRLLPADKALEMSVEYKGVAVFGTTSVVEEPEEAYDAFQMLLDKYFPHLKPGVDYRATTPEEWNRTSLFRLSITSWSGKQKKAPEDFPGAFYYGHSPIDRH